jgi:hypothetical protein
MAWCQEDRRGHGETRVRPCPEHRSNRSYQSSDDRHRSLATVFGTPPITAKPGRKFPSAFREPGLPCVRFETLSTRGTRPAPAPRSGCRATRSPAPPTATAVRRKWATSGQSLPEPSCAPAAGSAMTHSCGVLLLLCTSLPRSDFCGNLDPEHWPPSRLHSCAIYQMLTEV